MANPIPIRPPCATAGTILKIRLENFMCHSNLSIEIGDYVNFITGQNGSGKSAILTALCVAFGCRAKGTQRASTLKDFIKTGCSYALVHVEIKNQGDDAFKPELYGSVVIIERRITESTSSLVIKDHQGKKVASRREELRELVEHFNIDVENPCVIMSQDKSREFLHSGNDRDKFKFFFKATLLQQVNDLLENINIRLKAANDIVCELEASIRPVEKELINLKEKIKNMEHVEEISQQVQQLKKKLAWAWVYDVDRQLQEQHVKIGKLRDRIPACQQEIDHRIRLMEELKEHLTKKKTQIAEMVEDTSKVRSQRDQLQQILTSATKEKFELEQEHVRRSNEIQKMVNRIRVLEQQVQDIYDQHVKNTQAEEFKIEEKLKELQCEVDVADLMVARLKEAENAISESITQGMTEIRKISEELDIFEKKHHDISYSIRELRRHQTNKVTAFGGDRVINLLRVIERHHQRFKQPPVGPIGAHVNLVNDDKWAPAVEHAIGKLLNAFIVTDHKDSLLLRSMAREANYSHLQIIIYDFSRPRLDIPHHMIPQTSHLTTLSVLHSENHTVINVLVDMGSAERQVLVKDYDEGKEVAFDQRILNVKEVYTLDGYKMFSRASVQTILPPNKKIRAPRLCSSFDDQIVNLERVGLGVREEVEQCRKRKREAEEKLRHFEEDLKNVKRKCSMEERDWNRKIFKLRDLRKSLAAEASPSSASTVDELHQEISKIQEEMQQKEVFLEKLQVRVRKAEARANDIRQSYETLCKSAEGDIHVFDEAEQELSRFEKEFRSAEAEKVHYEGIMKNKVLPDIEKAEELYQEYEHLREEYQKKASIICSENETEAMGGGNGRTPEQLSAQLTALNQRLQRESNRFSESIEDLRMLCDKKQHKIKRKQERNKAFREKLAACQTALDVRRKKFQRNADLLKRQLTWQFNGHLRKKGISGHIKVSYEDKILSIEVKMPQDASSSTVRDTRGLSGGERSFSTLCFALALHEMTEAPFRAMDEFDVFMDAVSRKISLDTLVDFALAQGSQWIFITPHDISMVKQGERIKKQQMTAPRS